MAKKKKIFDAVLRILFFIASVAIIVLFCPNEAQYQYQFELGKPWQYDLLTADFDCPIYKDRTEFRKEREDVLNAKVYYFNLAESTKDEAVRIMKADVNRLYKEEQEASIKTPESLSFIRHHEDYISYLKQILDKIYETGLIDDNDYEATQSSTSDHIVILSANNMGKKCDKNSLYSVHTAKSAIYSKAPPTKIEKEWLRQLRIDGYLKPNLIYNEEITEKVLSEEYKNVSATQGMVQRGERIIDRGEIVTEEKYKILNSIKQESLNRSITTNEQFFSILLGRTLMTACLIGFFFAYTAIFRKRFYISKRYFALSLSLITIYFISTSLIAQYADPEFVNIVPFALVPMIMSTFYDTRTALFAHITTILLASLMVSAPLEFIILQLPVGMMTIFISKDVVERSQLIKCAVAVFLTYCLIYTAYGLILEGDILVIDSWMYLWFTINGILLLFAYPFIYVIEKTFGYTSNVTLLELSNTNHPLLRALSEEAPGTFQHVLQVANLSGDIAMELGANSLLARTGALYHDIGKTKNAAFFTENQHGGNTPHSQLTPQESAAIIIEHVKDGVELAKENHLPQCIIDIIQSHHGKNIVKYFYTVYANANPDKDIETAGFSYPGPNPSTMEEGIVMICDAIEASSRSLTEYTDETIDALVEKIVNTMVAEHSLDNTPIQLKQIEQIKEILKEKLRNIYHTRIAYPELKKPSNV